MFNMMKNLIRVAKGKTHELRPRKKSFNRFGSKRVGVRQSSVDVYEV